ncbi:MAG: DUF4097 family beta strand repeat-containing protein [Clostridia bacterium]
MKRIVRYVFLLSLLLFLIGASGLAYLYARHPEIVFHQVNQTPIQEEKRFDASKVKGLAISTDTTDISVVSGEGKEVIVRLTGQISGSRKNGLRFETGLTPEQQVTVDLEHQVQFGFNMGMSSSLDLQIVVPPKLYEELKITTSTGDIELKNVQANTMHVETSTGTVNVFASKGKEMEITTSTGDVEVTDSQAAYNIQSDTGDITLKQKLEQNVTINTSTGDVVCKLTRVPEAFRVDAESSTGDVDTEMVVQLEEKRTENSYFGTKGSNGPVVDIRSTTGSIRIVEGNEQGL